MTRNPADDFDDPTAPEGPLRRNVLYRIACPQTAFLTAGSRGVL